MLLRALHMASAVKTSSLSSDERLFGPSKRTRATTWAIVAVAGGGGAALIAAAVFSFSAGPARLWHFLGLVAGVAALAVAYLARVVASATYVVHPNYIAFRVSGRDRSLLRWDGVLSVAPDGSPPRSLRICRADEQFHVQLSDREDPAGLLEAVRREYLAEWQARVARTPDQAFYYPRVLLKAMKDGTEGFEPEKIADCVAIGGLQVQEACLRVIGNEGELTEIPYESITAIEHGGPLVLRWGEGRVLRIHPELSFFEKFVSWLEDDRAARGKGPP
ncbi:MAG: hypothetical protein HYZ53_05380 [Planctomycetes bacterium]|nr:hypothetical protein [Planctomycetota bacterium]